MGRKRSNPYAETSVYAEYYGYNVWANKQICLFAFSQTFKRDYKSPLSGREKAKKYLQSLEKSLGCKLKNIKMKTYIVTP